MRNPDRENALGREFHFRISVPALFPRLIVSVLTYSRLSSDRGRGADSGANSSTTSLLKNSATTLMDKFIQKRKLTRTNPEFQSIANLLQSVSEGPEGNKWRVEYGKDQLFVSRRNSKALATFDPTERKLSVLVWGGNTSRMLSLITQSVQFLLADCFPNLKFGISVVCPHCLRNGAPVPKTWPMSDLENRLLSEGDEVSVFCDQILTNEVPDQPAPEISIHIGGKAINSAQTATVLIREMIPDLALQDVQKIDFSEITIERQIGEGAFGEIYKAQYRGQAVAVKKLMGGGDTDVFKEFVNEVAFMSDMRTHEIVQLVGVSLKPLAMVQEFMDVGDLQKYLRKMPPGGLDLKTAAKIAFDIARGCQFLHSRTPPCIHADLKSPNILLRTNENGEIVAKLGDLGLSRSVFAPLNKRMVDNPRWLAPEILSNQEYNEMADVYSFAIILWEIVVTHLDQYQEPFLEFHVSFDTQLESYILQGLRPTIPMNVPHVLGSLINDCWQPSYFERPTFDSVGMTMMQYVQTL